jgi:trimeric autotransporter adhesin
MNSALTATIRNSFRLALTALMVGVLSPSSVGAVVNSADYSGGVAIGTGYAGVDIAPTNGLIVQGYLGLGTTTPYHYLSVNANSSGIDGIDIANAGTGSAQISFDSPLGTQKFAITNVLNGRLAFWNGTADIVSITSGGQVGIGTTAPRSSSTLDVNGTVYVASFASASSTTVCQNGNVLSTCSSAHRYKKNIEPMSLGLKEVLAMRPVTFDFRDHRDNWEKHDFGFIAEDMQKISPLFVTFNSHDEVEGVRYPQLTAVNAKAIQELYALIDAQNDRIRKLTKKIDELSNQLNREAR